MGELGTWLRESREAQAISLEETEAQTRIRRSFLQALEEGDYEALPGTVCVRGFLRNYALHLGLDPAEVHERYSQEVRQGLLRPPQNESGYRPIDAALEIPSRSIGRLVTSVVLIIVLVAGAAVVGVWYWHGRPPLQPPDWWPPRIAVFDAGLRSLQSLRISVPSASASTPTPSLATTKATASAPSMTPTPPTAATSAVLPLPTPTPVPTTTSTPTSTPPPAPSEAQGIELKAQVIERAWVLVSVDGEVHFEGVLEAGEERQWQAQHSIGIRCGNAGGVLVTIDGEELGPLGERGQVVNLTWTLQE